jgi:predicted small secreted protein
MKRTVLLTLPLLLGLALWGGCAPSSTGSGQQAAGGEQKMKETATPTPTPSQSAPRYSTDLDELRASFNRDKGKVRLVTLLSPT